MHTTNKAFERYFQGQADGARVVYRAVQDLQRNYNADGEDEKGKLLKLNIKDGGGGGSRTR
jgi:hypothetical protein